MRKRGAVTQRVQQNFLVTGQNGPHNVSALPVLEPSGQQSVSVAEPSVPQSVSALPVLEPSVPQSVSVAEPSVPQNVSVAEPSVPQSVSAAEPSVPQNVSVAEPSVPQNVSVTGQPKRRNVSSLRERYIKDEAPGEELEKLAFMHGSNMTSFVKILANGGLVCSNMLRKNGRATFKKDAVGPAGDVCYFRLVQNPLQNPLYYKEIIVENINGFSSVGRSGGIFFFMPSQNALNLAFSTLSAGDNKGLNRSPTLHNVLKKVKQNHGWINNNNTEIGFLRAVSLDRIAEIYIRRDLYTQNIYMISELYDKAVRLLNILKERGTQLPEMGRIPKNLTYNSLVYFFAIMAGYDPMVNVRANKSSYTVFRKTERENYVLGFKIDETGSSAAQSVNSKCSEPAPRSGTSQAAILVRRKEGWSKIVRPNKNV